MNQRMGGGITRMKAGGRKEKKQIKKAKKKIIFFLNEFIEK